MNESKSDREADRSVDRDTPRIRRRSLLETLGTLASILGAFVALIGGAFALYQYKTNSEGARAKEALTYIEHYNEPPISTSQESFTQYWLKNGFPKSDEEGPMVAAIRDTSIQPDALLLIRFFDGAAACTCKNLCDEELVRHFLGSRANDVFAPAGPYIYDRRQQEPLFGKGLEALAKNAALQCRDIIARR